MKFEKMHEIVYSSKIANTRNIIGIGYHDMFGVCTTVLIYCTQLFSNKRSRPIEFRKIQFFYLFRLR